MKINPILKNDLRLNSRTVKTAVLIFIFNSILAVITIMSFISKRKYLIEYKNINYYSVTDLYVFLSALQLIIILIIVPITTASSITSEKEKRTINLVLATQISNLQLVTGKLFSSISTVILLVLSSIPVLVVSLFLGGVSYLSVLQVLCLMVFVAIFMGSIGVFFSAVCSKTTTAVIFTSVVELLLVLLPYVTVMMLYKNGSAQLYSATEAAFTNRSSYLFLLSPVSDFYIVMLEKLGNPAPALSFFASLGLTNKSTVVFRYWMYISVTVKALITAGLIWLASLKLNTK